MVRKKNFLSFSVLVSEMSLLCLKRKVLYEFHPKCFKTTKRHSLVVFSSLGGEIFFVNIFPQFLVCSKSCLNKSKFSSGFASFQTRKKQTKISEYFIYRFCNSQFYAKKQKFSMNLPKNASKQHKCLA